MVYQANQTKKISSTESQKLHYIQWLFIGIVYLVIHIWAGFFYFISHKRVVEAVTGFKTEV